MQLDFDGAWCTRLWYFLKQVVDTFPSSSVSSGILAPRDSLHRKRQHYKWLRPAADDGDHNFDCVSVCFCISFWRNIPSLGRFHFLICPNSMCIVLHRYVHIHFTVFECPVELIEIVIHDKYMISWYISSITSIFLRFCYCIRCDYFIGSPCCYKRLSGSVAWSISDCEVLKRHTVKWWMTTKFR